MPQTLCNLEEYRIRASRLMKELRGPDPEGALNAAWRFRLLQSWSGKTGEEIAAGRDRIQHKHALAVIAREAGFANWLELRAAALEPIPGFDTSRLFQRTATFLNLWYRTYEEARAVLTDEPRRFLFPYRKQFVVCESLLLENQGIDTTDPDWERIGRDWVKPQDPEAFQRLNTKLTLNFRDRL